MYEIDIVTVRQPQSRGAREQSQRISVMRGVLQGDIFNLFCSIIALHRIFHVQDTKIFGISIGNYLSLKNHGYADDFSTLDGDATAASERLILISSAAESEGSLVSASQKSFKKHVRTHERLQKTTKFEVQVKKFGQKFDPCDGSFP